MNAIRFRDLRIAQAERVLAEIWICLEEYSIPSPKVHFQFLRSGRVGMTVYFSAVLSAKMVASRLIDRLPAADGTAAVRMLSAVASGPGASARRPAERDGLPEGGGGGWRSIS